MIPGLRGAAELFDRAIGAGDEGLEAMALEVAGRPGQHGASFEAGDLLVRRGLGEGRLAFAARVRAPEPRARGVLEAEGVRCEGGHDGLFVEVTSDSGLGRRAWRVADHDGRLHADTVVLRQRSARARSGLRAELTGEADPWADKWAWANERIAANDYGAVAKWLNGQSKAVIEDHFLGRMSLETIARLHEAARREPGVGPQSRFAQMTRYRYLVHRVLRAIKRKEWSKAAKYLNGFSVDGIRHRLQRVPLFVIAKLHDAAVANPAVGPRSNVATMTEHAASLPAFFPPRRSTAKAGPALLDGWKEEGAPANWLARERAMVEELTSGNMPSWLRHWVGVPVSRDIDGSRVRAKVFVLPDYLAVGDDEHFIHVPLDKYSAQKVADAFGAMLPTARICHAIYLEARSQGHHIEAVTRDYWDTSSRRKAPRGWAQTGSAAYMEHSLATQAAIKAKATFGQLVAGHKKDVVIAKGLGQRRQYVAFHGFYDARGFPREPCYEVEGGPLPGCARDTVTFAHPQHDGRFSDYSQGVRLVHRWMLVEGKARRVSDVLASKALFALVSAEGRVEPARVT